MSDQDDLRMAVGIAGQVAPDMVRDSGLFCGAVSKHDTSAADQAALDEILPPDEEPSHNAGHIREEHINLVRNEYADVVWNVEDVVGLFVDVSEADARAFLRGIEKVLRDRMTEHGWMIIRDEGMARGWIEKEN